LVDDFQPWRDCAQLILSRDKRLQIVGQAADGSEAVRKSQELNPDLVLLDIGLPRVHGLDVAHQLGSAVPSAKVLFVSENDDAEVVQQALSNGARGYVLKASAHTELLPAVEAVLMGKTFVSVRLHHYPNRLS
jgi:DNA-binding NarL/FixJ family response regulator